MSDDFKESIAAIRDLQFEATVSNEMDESERYHAQMMKTHVFDKLEQEVRDTVKERKNKFYVFFHNVYGYGKPFPHQDSSVIQETSEALNSLPWVANARFSFRDNGELSLTVYIQDPETKTRLFPSRETYGTDESQYYEGEKPKEIEQAPKPKALPPPTISPLEAFLIKIGLKKQPQLAIAAPVQEISPPAPEKTVNEKLSEQFSEAAESIKGYAAQIPGLKVDFAPLDHALEKIDALLTAKWDEDVFGAGRSSYRGALRDLRFLCDSFKEHAQILSVINKGRDNSEDFETVSPEQLSGLQRNFENVSRSVKNAATRAINARLDRAEIGIEVHDTRLQIEQFREVDLVKARTAKVTPEI